MCGGQLTVALQGEESVLVMVPAVSLTHKAPALSSATACAVMLRVPPGQLTCQQPMAVKVCGWPAGMLKGSPRLAGVVVPHCTSVTGLPEPSVKVSPVILRSADPVLLSVRFTVTGVFAGAL